MWERGNISVFPETVAQEIAKRNFQLLARFLQAEERIAAAAAIFGAGRRADFSFFDEVADITLSQIIVERDFGVLQHPQKFWLVLMEAPEREIEGDEASFLGKDLLETRRKLAFLFCSGSSLELFEVLIEMPDFAADLFLSGAMSITKSDNLVDGAFGVDPTQGMQESRDIKLPGIITENDQLF